MKTDLTLQKIEVDIKRTPVMAPWPEQMDLATSEDGNDDNEDAYSDIPFNFQGFLSFMTRRNDNANDIVDEDDSFNNESFYSAIEDEEHRQDIHSEQTLDQHHLHDEFSTLTLKQPVPASTKSTRNRLETNDSWVSSGLNIFPQGDGSFASSGLSFYDRVKFSWNQLRRLVHIIRKIVLKCVVYCVTTFIGLFAVSFDIIRRVYRHVKRRAPKFIRPLTAPQIHQGFWIAYANVRERIHMAVRSELLIEPADVLVTGHSLGGGLSTLCAVDLSIHTINKLNKHFLSKYNSLTFMAEHSHHKPSQFLIHHRHIHMTMYNIGSPPVGNSTFAAFYDRHIPDSFRIVNDGDMITSTSLAYCHIGTEIIIDGIEGSGSIIIDPSFVERQFRVRVKTSMTVHATSAYQAGIMSVLQAASDDLQELLIKREDASARSLESADYTNINVLLARYDSYQAVIKSVNEPSDPQENVETKIDGDSV